ncbi:MAG: hypothetical protein WCS87_20445, partial [Methylococcaceae bacterium]
MKIITKLANNSWSEVMPTREPDFNSSPSIPAISCPELTPEDLSHYDISKKENLKIEVSRYPQTRFWQVEVNDKLLAVVIYRRGWTFALFQPLFHDNPSIC